jgi:probable H4MPT-linked C1 transfer pathway protein
MQIVGLDIGGANLKAASADGQAASRPLEIWRQPDRLKHELDLLLASLPVADRLAVTMTAELADCFATKAEGVRQILEAVAETAAGRPVAVWQTGGEFVSLDDARELPQLVAAANWHALATFCGRLAQQGHALLIDIGTTTTDLVPIHNGMPVPWGLTDRNRLASHELVYTGISRTPVCSIASQVTLDDRPVGLAAELFATTRDVYLLTGDMAEDEHCCDTADGRPATRQHAAQRLARMLCCDRTEIHDDALIDVARQMTALQLKRLNHAVQNVIGCSNNGTPLDTVLLSGSGTFLARQLVASHPDLAQARQLDLSDCFSAEVASAACAFAIARLAQERVADFN